MAGRRLRATCVAARQAGLVCPLHKHVGDLSSTVPCMTRSMSCIVAGGLAASALLLAGCGSTNSHASAATSPSPSASPTPTLSRVAQCQTISPILSQISATLGKAGRRIILPLDALAEMKGEQDAVDAAAARVTSPDIAAGIHAVADAVGMMRVSLAETENIGVDASNAFDTAGKAFIQLCTA